MPCEDLFGWWTLRCGIWMVFMLALLGNGVVVVVLSFGRNKIDVPRFLVCNLAIADLFMGVYLGILAVVDASTLGEFREFAVAWQTSWGCQVAGVLGVLSTELSVFTLAVITLERNYAITHAMHLNKRLSLKHASYIMSAGWVFAAVMALLPLLGVSDYRKFAVCLPFEVEDSKWSLLYVVLLIVINGLAFFVLMGCYLRMYCAIRGSQAWNSNDSRIAKRMALLVFTDFLCWAPIAFFTTTAVSGWDLVSLEEAKIFTIFVLPLNSCCNPFLYAIFTKQFKKDCAMLCKRIEESRVTRGIGRGRNSSNFSNRQTPLNTNSAADKRSRSQSDGADRPLCQCGMALTSPDTKEINVHVNSLVGKQNKMPAERHRIKKVASRWFWRPRKGSRQDSMQSSSVKSSHLTSASSMQQRSSVSVSENVASSPSGSWNQTRIPMRVMDAGISPQDNKHSSWSATRKKSADSAQTTSSTFKTTSTTRSSVSSSLSASRATDLTTLRSTVVFNDQSAEHGEPTTRDPSAGVEAEMTGIQKVTTSRCNDGSGRRWSKNRSGVSLCGSSFHEDRLQDPSSLSLCHECSRQRLQQLPILKNEQLMSTWVHKNKALEDKLRLYFEKLAGASMSPSPADSSPVAVEAKAVSPDAGFSGQRDNLSQSGGTSETFMTSETSSEAKVVTPNPVIEVEPNSPTSRYSPVPPILRSTADDIFLSPDVEGCSTRSPSTVSVRTQIPYSGSPDPDDSMLLNSRQTNPCQKCSSATNSSLDIRSRAEAQSSHREKGSSGRLNRKVSSDTSLIRSIRHLPSSILRSFTSQRNRSSQARLQVESASGQGSGDRSSPADKACSEENRQPLITTGDDAQREDST